MHQLERSVMATRRRRPDGCGCQEQGSSRQGVRMTMMRLASSSLVPSLSNIAKQLAQSHNEPTPQPENSRPWQTRRRGFRRDIFRTSCAGLLSWTFGSKHHSPFPAEVPSLRTDQQIKLGSLRTNLEFNATYPRPLSASFYVIAELI